MLRLSVAVFLLILALVGLCGCSETGSRKAPLAARPADVATQPVAQSTPEVVTTPTASASGPTADLRKLGKIAYVYALDAATGEQRWRFEIGDIGDWVGSSPAVVDGVVYVGGGDGYVYAITEG